jgi:hypothetical protein
MRRAACRQLFQELHANRDGFAQFSVYLFGVSPFRRRRMQQPPVRARMMRNGRLGPELATVERLSPGVFGRAKVAKVASGDSSEVMPICNAT